MTAFTRLIFASSCMVVCLVFSASHLQAASQDPCFSYRFRQGDSLQFAVTTIDTIDFEDQQTLVRERKEELSLVCDFVNTDGHFLLRETLLNFVSKEHHVADTNRSYRSTSPWLGRSSYIILDSLGHRLIARQLDSSRAALSPGGAFATVLLMDVLDSLCHKPAYNSTWMVEHTDTLSENGFPYPLVRHLYSCAIRDTVFGSDSCYKIIYAETGQGALKAVTKDMGVYMRSVINGHGIIIISKKELLPLQTEAHAEIKATIQTPQGEKRGTIKSHSTFSRSSLSRSR